MSRTPAPEVAPPELPGYRFVKNIGAGGNAQVYLYEQNLPRRQVAVKVLNESALSEAARRRFTAEANVTAGLAHRHIVQVFEANVTPDGRPYLVMPYYPQPNLSVRARRSHFSVADVLRIGIQIGSAVETSHRRGVLHRDIKPQNILTDSYGEPALTDFGIATTKGGDGPEGLSVPWSPPEILLGTAPGDQRADVYSLGATLWHLLVGRSPFESPGDNGSLALVGRITADPPPRTQRSDVPDSLERLLRQTMAKDPAARPKSAMELIRGLQSVEQELRLPLTQPILPAEEPSGDTQGGDTIARPLNRNEDTLNRAPNRPAPGLRPPSGPRPGASGPGPRHPDPRTHSGLPPQQGPPAWGNTSQSAWGTQGTPPRAETIARGGGAAAPWAPPVPPRPAADNDNVTLKRGPIRIDPRGPAAAGVPTQGAYDAWANPQAAAPRVRQFPREAPETATVMRQSGGDPGSPAAGPSGAVDPKRKGGRGRVLALAGGGAALAVVAGVAVLALSPGSGQPGSSPSTDASQAINPNSEPNALGPGATAPGTPTITATRINATQVKFTWTYDLPLATDTFEWTREAGTVGNPSGKTSTAELIVGVPSGQTACYEVQVIRADGTASAESPLKCSP